MGGLWAVVPWFDNGGGTRSWRHVDVGFATSEIVSAAPRVSCPTHGPTVVELPWARQDSWFSLAFEDLVVFDAVCSNKLAVARRYEISWPAVNNACVRGPAVVAFAQLGEPLSQAEGHHPTSSAPTTGRCAPGS